MVNTLLRLPVWPMRTAKRVYNCCDFGTGVKAYLSMRGSTGRRERLRRDMTLAALVYRTKQKGRLDRRPFESMESEISPDRAATSPCGAAQPLRASALAPMQAEAAP